MRKPAEDDSHYPERIVACMQSLASIVSRFSGGTAHATSTSLYGLVLGAAYSLCESYHRLIPDQAQFRDTTEYFTEVRLKLHHHLPDVAVRADSKAFATELVGLHINTAQHFIHFLLDRLLNVLLQRAFDRSEQEMGFVFYNFVGMRVSLLRWRLTGNPHLGDRLIRLDGAFSRWAKGYQAGNCNDFVAKLLRNPEVKPPPDSLCSLEDGVRFTLGNEAGDVSGALAYIVDRTNEAKHLPGGAGRAQLALTLEKGEAIRRLYEVEWVVSYVAFERVIDLLGACLSFLDEPDLPRNAD